MKIGILEPLNFSAKAINALEKIGEVLSYDNKGLEKFLPELDAVFIRVYWYIDQDFLQQAKNLKYICSPTTGHSHIDEDLLTKSGIQLISLRDERLFLNSIRATPEHTLGLTLAMLRNYTGAFLSVGKYGWSNRDHYIGEEIFAKKIGIIGLGRIGYLVSTMFEMMGAQINYVDIKKVPSKECWNKKDSIDEVIVSSDIILITSSYINGQDPIITKDHINLLGGKYLVNTARGELIDEEYLIQAIKKELIRGFAADVISGGAKNKNLSIWKKLCKSRNVIITPHIGGVTVESIEKTELFIVNKFMKALNNANK